MTDQMQGRVLHPDHICKTPSFDRLRERGVHLTHAFTPNAISSPARASLMTGLLPHNHNVWTVTHTVREEPVQLKTFPPLGTILADRGICHRLFRQMARGTYSRTESVRLERGHD